MSKMNIEEAIKKQEERLEFLKIHLKKYEESNCKTSVYKELKKEAISIETLLEALDNSISKDKIREKIEEYKYKDFIAMQVVMKHDEEAIYIAEVLEELLKESE